MKSVRTTDSRERALLVGLGRKRPSRVPGTEPGQAERESLDELAELVRSAGGTVAGSILQMRDKPDPATLVGRGKLEEIEIEARTHKAPLVIFDANLTPSQQRNIEKALDCHVIDRTQLILDIFARHARSREGQLQVELAQLNYLLPRLSGRGTELSRLGGGIGTRGPGEQKLETDRRRIRDRVGRIKKDIEAVRKQRAMRREARQAVPLGTVALVGYTNAGKSTLFNALSKAGVLVSPRMFATLDPTVRAVRLPSGRRVLLSDTVGFIRDLPPALIAAFRATLEEVQEASLLLQVTDVSNPYHAEQDAEVEKVLAKLGVGDRPRLHVYNKIDQLPPAELDALLAANGTKVFVSALKDTGLEELLSRMDATMPVDPVVHLRLRIPLADGRTLALVHALGKVLSSRVEEPNMELDAELPESLAHRVSSYAIRAAGSAETK
ncbi:MAG TPA: GTPase HflX [Candidatus Acidoferrales bacterium]|jgi:GTP-binding protein HflX|nr:GTPase HflX [Candidatus Acidoferrales bacterium]